MKVEDTRLTVTSNILFKISIIISIIVVKWP